MHSPKHLKTIALSIFIASIVAISACSPSATPAEEITQNKDADVLQITGRTMGTSYSVKWLHKADNTFSKNASEVTAQIKQRIEQRLVEINKAMSTYDPKSEISTFNEHKVGVPFTISDDFYKTVTLAQHISAQTNGAFDATVSPLINLWGFGHIKTNKVKPTDEQVQKTLAGIGYKDLHVVSDNKQITKISDISINLSAIAKGYGVDVLAQIFDDANINNYFVEVGGEVITKGYKVNAQTQKQAPWVVGIEKPLANQAGGIAYAVNVSNTAIATSGDYRNYFEKDGVRYSHTIDPKTGYPITHKLASVSVLSDTCAKADALATALTVMGDEAGVAYAQKNAIDALFIIKDNSPEKENGFKEVFTGNFKQRLVSVQ